MVKRIKCEENKFNILISTIEPRKYNWQMTQWIENEQSVSISDALCQNMNEKEAAQNSDAIKILKTLLKDNVSYVQQASLVSLGMLLIQQSKYEALYVNELGDEVYEKIMSNTIEVCNHNNCKHNMQSHGHANLVLDQMKKTMITKR